MLKYRLQSTTAYMLPQLSLFQQCSIQSQDVMQTWLHWRCQDALLVQKHFVALFHPKRNECQHFDLESCNLHTLLLPTHVKFHHSIRLAPRCFASTLVTFEPIRVDYGKQAWHVLLGRSVMQVQRSVKNVRRRPKRTNYVERVRECERGFELHRTHSFGCFSRRPLYLLCQVLLVSW